MERDERLKMKTYVGLVKRFSLLITVAGRGALGCS